MLKKVLKAIAILLAVVLIVAIGYVAYRKKFLSDQGTKDIGKILLSLLK